MFDRLKQLEVLRKSFETQGWALAHQMFPAEVAAAMLHQFQRGLGNTPESYTGIWGKGPFKELLPTTSYFRVYRRGDHCALHVDRPAAEYAISLTLGYSDENPWPLWVSQDAVTPDAGARAKGGLLPDGTQMSMLRIPMQPGDAVIYDGVNRLHGRHDPNPNEWSAHLFYDFVDRHGPYAEHAFDKRDEFVQPSSFHFPAEGVEVTPAKKVPRHTR